MSETSSKPVPSTCSKASHAILKVSVEAFISLTDPCGTFIYDAQDNVTTLIRVCRECGGTLGMELPGRLEPGTKEPSQ